MTSKDNQMTEARIRQKYLQRHITRKTAINSLLSSYTAQEIANRLINAWINTHTLSDQLDACVLLKENESAKENTS